MLRTELIGSYMIRKALIVWLILIAAEIVHGIARGIFLVPHVGQFRSNQIGVFTGSLIILAVALVSVRWIGATRSSQMFGIGVLWLILTLAFEFLFGHLMGGRGSGLHRITIFFKSDCSRSE